MSVRLHIRPLYVHTSSTPPLCGALIHRHTVIKFKWYREGPFAGPLTIIPHMTVSVKCRWTLFGGPWTKGGLLLDFACYIRLCMALLSFNFHHISNSQVEWLTGTPSLLVKFIHLWTFTNTPFTPWLLCNGTRYQSMLLCCPLCLSSVWQSGLLTTSYPRHSRSVFNLICF